MKVNTEVEKLYTEHLVSALQRLHQEDLDQKSNNANQSDDSSDSADGPPSAGSPNPESRNQPGSTGYPENNQPLNPHDPNSWPDHLKKVFLAMLKKHNQRLENEAKENQKRNQSLAENKTEADDVRHNLLRRKDAFESAEDRQEYNERKKDLWPIIHQISRVFQRFLPIVDEPQHEFRRTGLRFSVKNLVKNYGSGREQPLGKRIIPEKPALALQILLDVSGSMYDQNRIGNAVDAIIATCEGAEGHNISIEILANDDKNISSEEVGDQYLIKSFDEKFDGRIKARIVGLLKRIGGENEDGEAIDVAFPRLTKIKRELRPSADRVGTLMIYITDSTTQEVTTKQAVDRARVHSPLEGTAVTPESEIPQMVRFHFGEDSIIPKSTEEFPTALQTILQRHIMHLKPRQ